MHSSSFITGDNSFYKSEDYINITISDFKKDSALPSSFIYNFPKSKEESTFGIHSLAARFIFLPSSCPKALTTSQHSTRAKKARDFIIKAVTQGSPWKLKRLTLQFDGIKIDTFIVGKPHTLENGRWMMVANGNGEFAEDGPCRNDYLELLEEIGGNGIFFNYPGVEGSTGTPNKENMIKSCLLVIKFLEENINANKIVLYGHSIGGGVVSEASLVHEFKDDKQYVIVKSRTFSTMEDAAASITNSPFLGKVSAAVGWNFDCVEGSKRSPVPEIILQTITPSPEDDYYPCNILTTSESIIHDGIIAPNASLAKALLDDATCPKDSKLFIGIPDSHNDQLSQCEFVASCINDFLEEEKSTSN